MSKVCYNPIIGCDDVIAMLIPGETKYSIANLRGMLEEKDGIQYVIDDELLKNEITLNVSQPKFNKTIKGLKDTLKSLRLIHTFKGETLLTIGQTDNRESKKKAIEVSKFNIGRFLRANGFPENSVSFEPTLSGQAVKVKFNNVKTDAIASENNKNTKEINKVISFLKSKFPNIDVKNINVKDVKSILGRDLRSNENSFIKDNTVYLINDRVTKDIAIEEMLHPFINTLHNDNNELFNNLYKEAVESYPELFESIKLGYKEESGFNDIDRQQELVTQVLSRVLREELKNVPKKLENYITLFKDWLLEVFHNVTNIFSKNKNNKNIFVEYIDPKVTYGLLAGMINTVDSEFIVNNEGTRFNMIDIDFNQRPIKRISLNQLTFELIKFKESLVNKLKSEKINVTKLTPSIAQKQLKQSFTQAEQRVRVKMISYLFSNEIDILLKQYPNLSRTAIVTGVTTEDGTLVGGGVLITNAVYKKLQAQFNKARVSKQNEKVAKYQKIFDNWSALMLYALSDINSNENTKLKLNFTYTNELNETNIDDIEFLDKYVAEESKRESWLTVHDTLSAIKSISSEVRRLISRIPKIENGEVQRDDLGFPIMMDKVRVHQHLMTILENARNSDHMMELLNNYNVKEIEASVGIPLYISQYLYLINGLDDPKLKSQFYVAFKRGFQPYSMLNIKLLADGIIKYTTPMLNRVNGEATYLNFLSDVKLGKPIAEYMAIYEYNNGKTLIIPSRIEELAKFLRKHVHVEKVEIDPTANIFKNSKKERAFYKLSPELKLIFLDDVFKSLNIKATPQTIKKVLNNRKDLNAVLNALDNIQEHGLALTEPIKTLEEPYSYEQLLNSSKKDVKGLDEKGILLKHITNILGVLNKNSDAQSVEKTARYNDTSYQSYVLPSFMTDLIDDIKSFLGDDISELQNYIKTKYLNNPYFVDGDGKILNKWLYALTTQAIDDPHSFINNFAFDRSLGTNEKKFEDFDRQTQMIQMLKKFTALDKIANKGISVLINEKDFLALHKDNKNKDIVYNIRGTDQSFVWSPAVRKWIKETRNDYADYHMFVLGDSGISKFIRAPKYRGEEVIELMYDVFVQEKRRMALSKEFNNDLESKGFAINKELRLHENSYTFLTFLNSNYENGKYAKLIDENNIKASVQNAITLYLTDRTKVYTETLRKNKVLDKVNGEYVHLKDEVTVNKDGTDDLNRVLSEYYWNTTFATIQQLLLMTIDPAFAKDSETLLKRFKQVSASGEPLDVLAIDPYSKDKSRYSETGKQKAIYFKDINVNAEEFASEFMEAIAYQYGKELHSLSANSTKPLTDEQYIEIGKKTAKYNSFKDITLTDGLSYRVFSSYRAVLGMSGKNTDLLLEAFEKIQEIRKSVGRNENITDEQYAEISKLQAVFQPFKPFSFTLENYTLPNGSTWLVPTLYKCSEMILIPELLPAGSKLREIAYYMEDNNIDIFASTETIKMGNFGSVDIKNNKNGNELAETLNLAYVHELNFADYRLQTNVPEHINASNLFGTQIRKLIMKNINKSKNYANYVNGNKVKIGNEYLELNGKNFIKFYNALISANIHQSFNEFKAKATNKEHLAEMIAEMTIGNDRESNDNLLAFDIEEFINPDGSAKKDFAMPLYDPLLEYNTSSLLLSWFRKSVNKQTIKGGSAVQASVMGLAGYEEDGGLKYIVDKHKNIIEVQTEIPWDLNYTDASGKTIELERTDWCNADGTLKMSNVEDKTGKYIAFKQNNGKTYIPLIELLYPNITSMVAYRIPTESEYSMINLRVVRFSPKVLGGTIKVPPQGTKIAGFDFDIDKLYFMRYNLKQADLTEDLISLIWENIYDENPLSIKLKLKMAKKDSSEKHDRLYEYWEEAGIEGSANDKFLEYLENHKDEYLNFETYDFNKEVIDYKDKNGNLVKGNSRVARDNMLIQLIQERLKDEETFKSRFTPGGFVNASIAAKKMRFLLFGDAEIDSNLNKSNKSYNFNDIDKNHNKYKDSKPNYNVIDPLTMIEYTVLNNLAAKLIGIFANLNSNYAISSLLKTFMLKEPILFGGMLDATNIDTSSRKGQNLLTKYVKLKSGRIVDTELSISEFLAASVDAVKDPVLNFLNLNTVTADSGALLARLGYSMEDIGLLFNQPIIKELCEKHFRDGNYSISKTISDLKRDYVNLLKDQKIYYKETSMNNKLNQETLAYNIAINRIESNKLTTDLEFIKDQLDILNYFTEIYAKADQVSDFVRNTKFTASNAIKSTFGDMYKLLQSVENYLNKISDPEEALFVMEVSDTQQTPYILTEINNNSMDYIKKLINNPFAYEQAMLDSIKVFMENIASLIFPYETQNYKYVRSMLTKLANSGILNGKTINKVHKEIVSFVLNSLMRSIFNPNTLIDFEKNGKRFSTTTKNYLVNTFPELLYSTLERNPNLSKLSLFENIIIDTYKDPATNTDKIRVKFKNVGGLGLDQIDTIKEDWMDLYENEETKELAELLFLYGFHTTGFNYGRLSILQYSPVGLRLNIAATLDFEGNDVSYPQLLRSIMTDGIGNSNDFIASYLFKDANNKDFQASFTNYQKGLFRALMKDEEGKIKDSVTVSLIDFEDNATNPLIRTVDNFAKTLTPIVYLDNEYFMVETFETESDTVTYYRFYPEINNVEEYQELDDVDFDNSQVTGISNMYNKVTEEQLIKLILELIKNNEDVLDERFKLLDIIKNYLIGIEREDKITFLELLKARIRESGRVLTDPETGKPLCK